MADRTKLQHKVMGWNDNKTGEQSNGLKVEVAIFIFLILAILVSVGFWLRVGWPSELPENVCNLLTVEAVNDYIEYKEKIRATQLQYLTTIAASLGAIGVVFNLYYTGKREEAFNKSAIAANKSANAAIENAIAALKNAEAAQDKQITERFTKAVEQLASSEIAVRLGGIYALERIAKERIAKDSEKDHWTIMEILTAFVREPPPLKAPLDAEKPLIKLPPHIQKAKDDKQLQKLRIDIQAALTVIGRRDTKKDPENQELDLRKADIAGANLSKAKLQGANFYQANLQGANFYQANLQGVNLDRVNLEGANLDEANLQWAKLCNAKLQKATLRRANLGHASLNWAELQGAILNWAELQGAILDYARLEMAYLSCVNLRKARLCNTKLEGAILSKANLEGANFDGAVFKVTYLDGANMKETSLDVANLEGTNLSKVENLKLEQIQTAFIDSYTILPDDY